MRNPFFWGAVAGIIAMPLLRPLLRRVPDPPAVIGHLPAFTLVDQHGRAFGSRELRGKVYVANFFFTRCPSICPKLTRAMHKLQQTFASMKVDVRLVSISVDPEHDQPAQLRAYARKYGADTRRWTFLTASDPQHIRTLVTEGFKSHVGKPQESANVMDIAHSGSLVLVDREGGMRGLYPAEPLGIEEIVHRAVHVLLAPQK